MCSSARYVSFKSHLLFHCSHCLLYFTMSKYRLYTEEKVSMEFIILSDKVVKLINTIETVPRCLAGFYHVKIAKQQLHSYSTV